MMTAFNPGGWPVATVREAPDGYRWSAQGHNGRRKRESDAISAATQLLDRERITHQWRSRK